MADRNYAPYFTVAAEGHRIGLMVCRRCGATVLVTEATAMPENPAEIHDAWHAAQKPTCFACEHDEWTHNLSGDGRCIPECGCRRFKETDDA